MTTPIATALAAIAQSQLRISHLLRELALRDVEVARLRRELAVAKGLR